MKRAAWPAVAAALAPALLLLSAVLLGVAVAFTLEPGQRQALAGVLAERGAPIFLGLLVLAVVAGTAAHRAWEHYGAAPARLAEDLGVRLRGGGDRPLAERGSAGSRALAAAVNELLRERAAWRDDLDAQVRDASRRVEQERSRLAALMAELTQSVVVCNLDGRILLYNSRARLQFRALSDAPAAGGSELIGIGRSIYTVFDRALVSHALESVQQRLQRGVANPATQFVTSTRGGQLLRVQMAPVREPDAPPDAPLNGFVLMLDNITREFADESGRDRTLHAHTEASRASLGNLKAAVELLDEPELDAATRERLQGVVRSEVAAMTQRIGELAAQTTETMKTRWPLEEMQGADLVAAALRRIERACGCRTASDEIDAGLWLKVDSYSLIQALAFLAGRLVDEYEVRLVRLRLQRAGQRAQLDLAWIGAGLSTETVVGWETDALRVGDEATSLTVRDVVQRHGGAFWFERERVRHESFFRFLLPLAEGAESGQGPSGPPEDAAADYYDFDLFGTIERAGDLADRPLAELSYTVFDTETTGLDPGGGDEIIQIGAVRIVNARLLRGETFDQLVDPQRPIPAATIPIHGITPERVAGQPTLARVLPAFHAFARDTVLIAHNAAFDMRFLRLKEAPLGVRFEQPVLDTLLLSSVVQPNQDSHRLEAIAERLGIEVVGRHTALGDALVTAQVFLKLLPLLAERGVHTLAQAHAAAERSAFARLKY